MAGPQRSVLREGIVAGLIGAAVVAVWFFVYDIARGEPFRTPTLLGAFVFFGVQTPTGLDPSVGLILGYTVLHGLAFIAFGVIAASLMAMSEREPALFIGFIILFACFEAFFFAMVQVFGLSKAGELTWWSVLVGNLLASVAMLWYFFRAHRALRQSLVGSWGAVIREGVLAGIVGAAVVALWFFAIDAIHGELLRTPTLLGTALLRQQTPLAAVLSYTVVHGVAFVLFGIIGAFLIAGAEQQPMLIFALVILFTSFEIFFFGLILIAASWVMDELAGWTVFVGNVLAAAAMLAFYFRRHRGLAHRLAAAWEADDS
jgi:hypothetical protein